MHKTILFLVFSMLFSFSYGQNKYSAVVSIENTYQVVSNTLRIQAPLSWSYQTDAPSIPFYNYTFKIPSKGKYSIHVEYLDSSIIESVNLPISYGLEKKYESFSMYESSYFIEQFYAETFFPKVDFISISPIIARDLRLQTFHIFPFKYNAQKKQLKIYTVFRITLIKESEYGENEQLMDRNFNTTRNAYSHTSSSSFISKYQPISENGEMLIVYRNTSDSLIRRFAHWKEQMGIRCHLLKLDNSIIFPEDIKQKISDFYDSIPDILYLTLVGDFNEIPSYLYKQFLNDDYYSDTYYGFLDGVDFVPELFVGRFSGDEAQNRIQIDKTIFYEKYGFYDNYEKNLLLIGSNQGANIGDDNEIDWQHLRNIGTYLANTAGMIPSELFDGSQGGLDATGDPTKDDVKNGINSGKGFIYYTGHGDFSVMNTGNFFTMHVKQLENYNQLPIVISVACNHGKYIGIDCMAEVFVTDTKNNQFTGSVAFTGSTILMSWAPPMETQDEFSRLMNPNIADYKSTLGAAFYNSQLSMLEHYPTTYGEEVMQTWILFGDPSLKMRVNQKGEITLDNWGNITSKQHQLTFSINENDCFVSLSQNDSVIARGISKNHSITFDNVQLVPNSKVEIVASKSNYRTYLGQMNVIKENDNPFTLYPNPVSKEINIVGLEPIKAIEIVDVSGKIVANYYEPSKNSFNLEFLSAGVYTIIIHTDTHNFTSKIVKINDN